jgi:hypothetical protein
VYLWRKASQNGNCCLPLELDDCVTVAKSPLSSLAHRFACWRSAGERESEQDACEKSSDCLQRVSNFEQSHHSGKQYRANCRYSASPGEGGLPFVGQAWVSAGQFGDV